MCQVAVTDADCEMHEVNWLDRANKVQNSETFESLNGGLELTLQSFVFNWIQNLILSSIYHFNGYIIAKVWPC